MDMKKTYKIDVDCANCANKMEEAAKKTAGVKDATVNFMTLKMIVEFEEGQGFEASPEDVAIAVGLEKGSELVQQINEILAGLSDEERQQMMDDAVARQPVSE